MRKIFHILLSLVIVYATTISAYANTSIGGWTATDTIIAGANTTINAIKNGANGALKSAVTVAPTASKVGKFLIKGGGTAALLIAVPQLIGDAVDWVLDPANNAVKYKKITGGVWKGGNVSGATPEEACSSYNYKGTAKHYAAVMETSTTYWCWYKASPASTPSRNFIVTSTGGQEEDAYLPIETVAAQVISNAAAGEPNSQEAVKATALEGFAAGEHDAALDAAAEPDTATDNPTDPNNPTEPADPAAPFDPSSIIAAINALKALLAGILSSITGLADIFNDDPPPEKSQSETDVPVDLPPEVKNATEFDVDYIGFSSQCPTLQPFSVGIGAASSTMTFDMTPLCELAVTIRPAIIAIAYFIGLGVIASAIRET